ncbi:hypothetical protein JCM3775_000349 [Rhodotorula graminis]
MSIVMPTPNGTDLHALLGLSPSSPRLAAFLSRVEPDDNSCPPPEVKAYADIVYLNYRHIGLSLSFEPLPPLRPSSSSTLDDLRREGDNGRLKCTGLDLYNHDDAARARPPDDKKKAPRQRPDDRWEPFPAYPVLLPASSSPSSSAAPPSTASSPPSTDDTASPAATAPTSHLPFPLQPSTTGAALLTHFGEPTRKGGGSSSTPGVGIWTEWTPEGVMVEWASSGLGAWDKGGESTWRCLSVFEPGKPPAGA